MESYSSTSTPAQLAAKKNAKVPAGGATDKDLKRFDSLRTDKKRLLENVIFPSMANLIYFFESINYDPVLKETFENAVEDLLGVRRKHPNPGNYGLYFTKLVEAVLDISADYDKDDFRLRLTHEIHKLIKTKMTRILPSMIKNSRWSPSSSIRYAGQDIGRALSWTEMASNTVEDRYDFDILLKEGASRYANHRKIEAPDRTLYVDTKWILSGRPDKGD
ncbi:MAG: hypothetical protein M3O24_00800 [Thermoproteota archaeon]|nr:hypothetical protein [Thermoproteota archaeon]